MALRLPSARASSQQHRVNSSACKDKTKYFVTTGQVEDLHWRVQRGPGGPAPCPPRFFQNHALFRQFWAKFGLRAPPWVKTPLSPDQNPGSARDLYPKYIKPHLSWGEEVSCCPSFPSSFHRILGPGPENSAPCILIRSQGPRSRCMKCLWKLLLVKWKVVSQTPLPVQVGGRRSTTGVELLPLLMAEVAQIEVDTESALLWENWSMCVNGCQYWSKKTWSHPKGPIVSTNPGFFRIKNWRGCGWNNTGTYCKSPSHFSFWHRTSSLGIRKRSNLSTSVSLSTFTFVPENLRSGLISSFLWPNPHRTRDATHAQIGMFFLWCCLRAVWTPPFTSTGPICSHGIAHRIPCPVWIGPVRVSWKKSGTQWHSSKDTKLQAFCLLFWESKKLYIRISVEASLNADLSELGETWNLLQIHASCIQVLEATPLFTETFLIWQGKPWLGLPAWCSKNGKASQSGRPLFRRSRVL